jgi:FkbM family methyltransferase
VLARGIGRPLALVVGLLPDTVRFVVGTRIAKRRPLDHDTLALVLEVATETERGRLLACRKEPETVAWLERHRAADMVLYDVGANVGAYSLIAAELGGPAARVVAVEPGATTYPRLVRNIAANRLEGRVVALPVALGARTGLTEFGYSSLEPGAAEHPGVGAPAAVRLPVLCYRLDDLVHEFGLPRPTLLKIDVDGAEVEILRGAGGVLAPPGLRSVLVEVREGSPEADAVRATLEGHGFALEDSRLHQGGVVRNLIFTRGGAPG